MAEVSPAGSGHQHGSVGSVGRTQALPHHQRNGVAVPGRTEPASRDVDRVELSDRARQMNRTSDAPVRMDRVEAAREAIREPDFASGERLGVALERLIDDLRLDEQMRG